METALSERTTKCFKTEVDWFGTKCLFFSVDHTILQPYLRRLCGYGCLKLSSCIGAINISRSIWNLKQLLIPKKMCKICMRVVSATIRTTIEPLIIIMYCVKPVIFWYLKKTFTENFIASGTLWWNQANQYTYLPTHKNLKKWLRRVKRCSFFRTREKIQNWNI